MMIFWLKETQSREAFTERPAAVGHDREREKTDMLVSFFLALLQDNFALSLNRL